MELQLLARLQKSRKSEINRTVEALGRIKTAPWWLYKTQLHSGRTLRVLGAIWVERHEAAVSKWEMGGSWEEVMSWVMADRVGQSEHHYSAGFFSQQGLFQHSSETFCWIIHISVCWDLGESLRWDVESGYIWCSWKLLMKESNRRDLMKHEYIMSFFQLDALVPIWNVHSKNTDVNLWQTTTTSYQTVKLGNWALAAWLADVPDLDTALATGVDVTCGVADGDSTHHFPVAQCVDLASVARDAWAYQCIWREGHWLHLTICTHMKRISPAKYRGRQRWSVWAKKHVSSIINRNG